MLPTAARLLRLLSLLQLRRDWTGSQLAAELQVSARTVRKDVERLRALGYPVHAAPGLGGGYRLGAGTSLPPLLLDDEEAVAVAIGLRTGAAGGVAGIEEASLRALAKLEDVLPDRLRRRVGAVHEATVAIPRAAPAVEAGALAAIAAAVRDRRRLRFAYESFDGGASRRTVEPHRLVHTRGRWYLVAWDTAHDDWRLFRVDRMTLSAHTGPGFARRRDPEGDLVTYVERGVGRATWHHRARVRVHAPATQVAARVPPAVVVEAIDENTCVASVGSDSPDALALWLGFIDADFEIDGDDPELADALRRLAARYERAAG